ncbi:MAG: carph-isopro domain-containing protein [Brevundimonas sp.]
MSNARTIIEKFGGTRPLAAALGLPPSTVQSWKDHGFIPSRRQRAVLDCAERLGVPLAPSDFFAEEAA